MGFEKICDITIDWMIDNIIMKPCIYCGDITRVGCDRINNDLGHTMDNVVPCCYDCNCARIIILPMKKCLFQEKL